MNDRKRIQVNDIKVIYRGQKDADDEAVHKAASLIYRKTGSKPYELKISKKSIDARRDISFVYTVSAVIEGGRTDDAAIKLYSEPELGIERGNGVLHSRPVVIGFGPAGIFASLLLAENGMRPIVFERGADVDERVKKVETFMLGGTFDPSTNIQFGAGGAGTFSDGKLTTRINDPKIALVLEFLHALGAPDDIIYKAKPHIGTDVLRNVIRNADEKIRSLGGEIHYNTKAEIMSDGSVAAGGDRYAPGAVVLAVGHSARDTYSSLLGSGYIIEAKPFSVGVRAEHLQSDIDKALYHDFAGDPTLGHGEYQLSYRRGERGCYTFCMCPGGTVVPSASEEGGVVTNGMSSRARDGRNANAAVCVSVLPSDYGSTPTGAIEFQRTLERAAFEAGGRTFAAPLETVGDLMSGFRGSEPSDILPTYRSGDVRPADLEKLFPSFVTEYLRAGLYDFGKKIKGYDNPSVPLTGVETRTSAPVRILRGDDCTAVGHPGVYPCGEGAGYAGGIVSAAVDGLRVASEILKKYGKIED